jgi:hypothetical protein
VHFGDIWGPVHAIINTGLEIKDAFFLSSKIFEFVVNVYKHRV